MDSGRYSNFRITYESVKVIKYLNFAITENSTNPNSGLDISLVYNPHEAFLSIES